MKVCPTLQTARLTLRPLDLSDGPRVKELAGDRAIADTTGSIAHPYEDGMAERWIEKQRAAFEAGTSADFAVALRPGGDLVGAIGLVINPAHRRAELGYWLGQPYWGQGYGTEAARAVIAYGFADRGLARIAAHHFQRNAASGRLLQKIGMTREGLLRQYFLKWDALEDVVCHAILRAEWAALTSAPAA